MPNSLIFSSCFDGHRQVHVFVYAHILHKLGFKVFIAGNFQEQIINSFYIDKLKSDENITLIDTNYISKTNAKISISEFLDLQQKYKIDLTIFAEADEHIDLFTSQIISKKRLNGINVGLFFRPLYFYRKSNLFLKIKYLKQLPSKWKTDDILFHEYLLKKYKLLNTAFYLDEKFVLHHKNTKLLPDVFQSYANHLLKDEYSEQRVWIDRLNNFKAQNQEKFIFLYFGTVQKRRGYDLLLEMAVKYDACFVHCGLPNTTEEYGINVIQFKNSLKDKGRLLETNEYIYDPTTIECFFKATNHLILPYEKSLGSSGVMLQALEYGIPCLMPDTGAPSYLIKKYKLGLTYNYSDELFEDQLKKFIKIPTSTFKPSIEEYMKSQSIDELENRLIDTFIQVTHFDKRQQ